MPTERTRLEEIRKGFRGLIMAGVQLAILRHDLGDDDMDMEEIMCDAANAAEGIDTCADEPIQEWTNLLSLVEKLEKERNDALDNADFWERELNNFRRNAAHRAEQLAKEKIDAAQNTLREIRSLCLDPKEKDGCQTVGARVVRLCDEALKGER